jgi:hypothetical protein
MAADFSKIRSNPLRDYAGVNLQQGRVLLDADFNELVATVDRRLRAATSDILGRSTVSQTTPGAFKVTAAAGTLRIAKGRLYVDGLLAENHGAESPLAAQRSFDALLAEPTFTDDIAYTSQPYLPSPPPLPAAGKHLVYLDVWQREVTALEQPDLVEVALGVDSTTRQQTVWQVRVLASDAGSAGCASPDADVPGWAALTAPSGGRLSVGTYDVPPATDPCDLPPSGGYRGPENQTYRVQIHDAGAAGGGATFVWSRENASVGSRVASVVSDTELELQSLGRDDVLRFNTGDWVEITDDVRELSQRSGELRRITVNDAARRVTFTPPLPAELLPAGALPNSSWPQQRNLRVRRWDQAHQVLMTTGGGTTAPFQDLDAAGATGAIRVPAAGTTLLLESGLTVNFSTVGSAGFKAGDFWVFAARTADASVELLDRAPPRGTHHHHARLGFWDVAAGSVSDCRTPWPPAAAGQDCSCTVCVTPQQHSSGQLTVQAAVDRVRDTGGTVCLTAGQYVLEKPVQLNGAQSVRMRGQGTATLLIAPGTAFSIVAGVALALEDMAVLSAGEAPAITINTALGLTLQRLLLVVLGGADKAPAAITLNGAVLGATLRDNTILAPIGIRTATAGNTATASAPPPALLTALLRIEGNVLWCERAGVLLGTPALHLLATHITGNELLGCRQGAVTVLGACGAGASMHISGNSATVSGPGITASVDGLWINDNRLAATRQANGPAVAGAGISLRTGLNPKGGTSCQVLANQVSGFAGAGISIGMPVRALVVKLNTVQQCGNGIVCVDNTQSDSVAIENNQVLGIGLEGDKDATTTLGIAVLRAELASVVGNSVARVAQGDSAAALRAGVMVAGVRRATISGNHVFDIGPAGNADKAASVGILLVAPWVHADVAHNQVDRETLPLFDGGGDWAALRVDGTGDERGVLRVAGYTALRANAATTLVLGGSGGWLMRTMGDAASAAVATKLGFTVGGVSVLGNALAGRGDRPVVHISTASDCLFNDNRCEQRGSFDDAEGRPAVLLRGATAIVNANRVRGGAPSISITVPGELKTPPVTVVGNITSGSITGMPAVPWAVLNVRG